jgi:hypothetical protein
MLTRHGSLALLMLCCAGCGAIRPRSPVTVGGPDLAAIAGSWTGSYESPALGRDGSIAFELSADGDSATGDVVMTPSMTGLRVGSPEVTAASAPAIERTAQVLTIRFVRVEGDQVRGALDPYEDPDCRCVVATTFTGRVRGNRIRGTFVTRGRPSLQEVTGSWSVQRTR